MLTLTENMRLLGIVFPFEALSSKPEMIWFHAGADLFICFAYFASLAALIFFLRARRDLRFRFIFALFGLFLFFAGTTHLIHLLAPWYKTYGFEGLIKLIAAVFALISSFLLWRLIPKVVSLPAPSQLEEAVEQLNRQKAIHEQAEAMLREDQAELELIIQKRTSELTEMNEILKKEIIERNEAEREIRLLPLMMQAISEAEDFHSALEVAIQKVCEVTRWDYGEAWVPRPDGKILECSPVWYGPDSLKAFREMRQELRFPLHIGLAGSVWASKKPRWLEDMPTVQSDINLFRAESAEEAGIKAAFAVPIVANSKVLAVLAFFILGLREEDKRLVDLVSTVAAQLGSVIQRKRAEEALRKAHEELERRIQERTKELQKANQALQDEIVERSLIEESLRKSQGSYQTLVNSIDGIVWEYDLDAGKFLFVSQQAERILGYPPEAWLVQPTFWQDHIHGADRAAAVAFRAKVAQEKKDGQYEYRMVSAVGQRIWFRDMVTVVIENERATKLRGAMVDITETQQVEDALNQERNFVSAVLDTAGALVLILDSEGRIVRFNRACEQISGYTANEIKEKYFWDLFVLPEEVSQVSAIFTRLLAGQFPINYESSWIAKDGNRRTITWTSTILNEKEGSVVHVIATGIDITTRKEAEKKLTEVVTDLAYSNEELDKSTRELKEANERLKKLDELKSHFISAASHELRTPLTSLKGYVEAILQGEVGPINEKQNQFLGYVKEATERLHRLLNDLLDISKIESGQVKMTIDLINLRNLLKEEITVFKPQAHDKEISLSLETDENLQPIYCDADKIREVMDNLVSNAIKYTPRNGKIKIFGHNSKNGVQIEVRDTGIGIRNEDLHRVFEPFQCIEKNGIDREESTGLGLTLVKKIVEAHGGEIRVKSEEGKGSSFSVILPHGSKSEEEAKPQWAVRYEP
ncbi:MAG: PAS domain S-box protein [Candidatus Omnitrophica bacterium]|nr:PAS domain S-box protein [Candidatus Omnitrophota bacterium]